MLESESRPRSTSTCAEPVEGTRCEFVLARSGIAVVSAAAVACLSRATFCSAAALPSASSDLIPYSSLGCSVCARIAFLMLCCSTFCCTCTCGVTSHFVVFEGVSGRALLALFASSLLRRVSSCFCCSNFFCLSSVEGVVGALLLDCTASVSVDTFSSRCAREAWVSRLKDNIGGGLPFHLKMRLRSIARGHHC